jgi:hypothetical protein
LLERIKLGKRLMLRGYVLQPDLSVVEQIQNVVVGPSGPFRVLFRMTSDQTEAANMLATGAWHGRRQGEAQRLGLPLDYLGVCDPLTSLPHGDALIPLPTQDPTDGDDYAMGCMGWVNESQAPGTVPLYRLTDQRNGAQFYTISDQEADNAVRILGFKRDGVCCFVSPAQASDTKPVFRVMCSETGHFYTPQAFVKDWMVLKEGCADEGTAFYIWGEQGTAVAEALKELQQLENGLKRGEDRVAQ